MTENVGISRRHALRLGRRVATGAALLGLAGTGAVRSAASALPQDDSSLGRPMRIGYLPITDASALLTAYESGGLRRAGVEAERPILFRSWDSMAQALTTNQIDAVHMLMPMALQLRMGKGAALKVTAWGHTNGSALVVSPTLTDVVELAGKKVAIPFWWSAQNIIFQQALLRTGLKAVVGPASTVDRTVELLVMAPSDFVPALKNGSIAGFVGADPFPALAEVTGAGKVLRFLGDIWQDHACCAITVREELTDEYPDLVARLTRSVVDAQQWLDSHRSDAASILSPTGYLPQPAGAINKVFNRSAADYGKVLVHPSWHGERLNFTAFPRASYTKSLVELMRDTTVDGDTSFLNGLTGEEAHRELVNDSFVTAALHGAGLPVTNQQKELIEP